MNKQEQHVNEYTDQTCINLPLNDLSQLANNSMKDYWFEYSSYRSCMHV